MKRSDFIRFMGIGTVVFFTGSNFLVLLPSCKKDNLSMDMEALPVNVVEGKFLRLLPIPLEIITNSTLTAQHTFQSIFDGKISQVLGYHENSILGPTIKIHSGEIFNITFHNNLSESSNIHWHGIIAPEDMDGHPENVAQPGGQINYVFPIIQRAGMYWYHPHPDKLTAKQVYLGLAGALIVKDSEEQNLNLPSGEFEIPLIIQDKRIFPDYALDYSPNTSEIMSGYMGQYVTVNGVYAPFINLKSRCYRFRILNGSNGRIYNLALSNESSFIVIGSDGGLLEFSQSVTSLLLGPGERADILIDFSVFSIETELFLVNKLFSAGTAQGTQKFKIMKLIVSQLDTAVFLLPDKLSVIHKIPETQVVKTRIFYISNSGMAHSGNTGSMLGSHRINNKSYDKNRIDEIVQADSTEIWIFDNSTGAEPHPMHIHALQFQILDRTGGRNCLIPTEMGWKDTVLVLPSEKVRIIMTFGQTKGNFVLHCHNLEHEDDGMMLQFIII